MTTSLLPLFPPNTSPNFSGHETFALRSNWLKKAYDVLQDKPDLFYREDAFVLLGVGKNMAQSIRFWGRVCGVFMRAPTGDYHQATPLGRALLADDGWDPFLVTPSSHWLLHWQIAARPEAAFTWFYTFNLLKGGEFSAAELARQLRDLAGEQGWRVPSEATVSRDVECMLNCYTRSRSRQGAPINEDLLLCPLTDLDLIQPLPGQHLYRVTAGPQLDLSDALVAYATFEMMRRHGRQTMAFSDLAYAPRSPGRVFRLHDDALLSRLQVIDQITDGRAYYSDQAGIRQIAWPELGDDSMVDRLLDRAFSNEASYV
ncbi:MAG: DUF4007 family protein [Chloroflexota bacterium]|nr:DUF4007 family protein [Chloroflexota bacterium]